jgi:hypothetical protein
MLKTVNEKIPDLLPREAAVAAVSLLRLPEDSRRNGNLARLRRK